MNNYEKIGKVVVVTSMRLAIIAVFALLVGYPVKWLLNYVFTPQALLAAFGVAKVGFWRAYWLSWLCSILVKSNIGDNQK